MKITNTSRAPQGVHSTAGLVFIEPGETKDVDVAKGYVDRVKSLPYFTLGGKAKAEGGSIDGRDANGDTPEMAELRKRFDGAWKGLSAEHEKAKADLAAATATVTTLTDRVAELELANEELRKNTGGLPEKLEATHRGRGSFSIMDGKELVEGLDKEGADKFNALSDEDKAKFVAEALKTKAA